MTSAIETWVQDQHLDPKAIEQYHREFTEDAARLLVIPEFLRADRATLLANYLAEDLEYETKYGLYSEEATVPEESWSQADEQDRFFRFSQPVRVRPESQLSPNTLAYMQFKTIFSHPESQHFFESVTGLRLAYSSDDIGAHRLGPGDFMGVHDDDNRDRQLAFIIYLTPEWDPAYGGALRVVDRNGALREVAPIFNSLAMFDVLADTKHEVLPVEETAGTATRRTIGGWYHRRPE